MVLHQGDFDYYDNADNWDNQINDILGESFPYFASVGNHDVKAWEDYREKLVTRLAKIKGAECSGDYGVNSACTYKELFFVLSGVGTLGSDHEYYIKNEMQKSNATWKICSWHKNQKLMQVGGKNNEVGWLPYDICRIYGAIIVTGHEHSYSRTHLMKNFEKQEIADTSDNLIIENGKTIAVVSGIAGHSIRVQNDSLASNPWWASVYTKDQNANYGSLFCNFKPSGDENKAICYFKDIQNNIPDSFVLIKE